jgi:glycosyltransferase involved in cell wall biosynthesis
MRVLNVMLSRGLGGIESAFAHYAQAVQMQGHAVICCVSPGAEITAHLPEGVAVVELPQASQYDPQAIWRAHRLLKSTRPDVVLVHGKRGQHLFLLARRIFGKYVPLVVVLHRHRFQHLYPADRILCVSRKLRAEVLEHGIAPQKVAVVPNFLVSSSCAEPTQEWHSPPVIGVLGRMVEEKGLDIFLEALAILKKRGVEFRAEIGGTGPLRATLQAQAAAGGLGDVVSWRGWIENTAGFFARTDVFCSPSRHESFGIVLIEAFRHGKPVLATATIGASEIVHPGQNGLLCAIAAGAIADGLAQLLFNHDLAFDLAVKARADSDGYMVAAIAPQIERQLQKVITAFQASGADAAAS